MTPKHLWLELTPFWASMDPANLTPEGWAALDPSVHEEACEGGALFPTGSPQEPRAVSLGRPPAWLPLLPSWSDAPTSPWSWYASRPKDTGVVCDAPFVARDIPIVRLREAEGVTLCGQTLPPGERGEAGCRADATCVDCLHWLELGERLVIPFEHAYRTCQGQSGMCRRCYTRDAPFRALVSK